MYQWRQARQASRHERECPENTKPLALEFGIYHDEDSKQSENSTLPINISRCNGSHQKTMYIPDTKSPKVKTTMPIRSSRSYNCSTSWEWFIKVWPRGPGIRGYMVLGAEAAGELVGADVPSWPYCWPRKQRSVRTDRS
ncbi:hypothetical protein FE257_002185 [Aspergillus nanangensis]|uniref:Uncharacterized protein n=1 Tax=Aspergillus nanangensis TaxID=2582783 RepID=A0AAD4CCZ6_ASPNN|nr:hypothetical protein FE257_002185 [Aspergillus nanangensis]